ncbi:MAG: hypothetical protein ACRENO_08990 [Thermodesulfobacteriota bacterium]
MILNILIIIISGVAATSAMALFMDQLSKKNIANANMVKALGTIFTKNQSEGYSLGLKLHYIAGVIIAFVYAALISLFTPSLYAGYVGLGAMVGLFHGFAFSFLLVIAVAEHHPIEEFRTAGFGVALAHLAGHIVYGLVLGAVIGLFRIKFLF